MKGGNCTYCVKTLLMYTIFESPSCGSETNIVHQLYFNLKNWKRNQVSSIFGWNETGWIIVHTERGDILLLGGDFRSYMWNITHI